MEKFIIGDFIRLKNVAGYQIDRNSGGKINIFEINNIEPEYVKVNDCKEQIPISEIESIQINGVDDFEIYWAPIIKASIEFPNDPIPIWKTDYSYYYDAIKRSFDQDKCFQVLINEQDLRYVHQVQHFLFDIFEYNGLRIDAI